MKNIEKLIGGLVAIVVIGSIAASVRSIQKIKEQELLEVITEEA